MNKNKIIRDKIIFSTLLIYVSLLTIMFYPTEVNAIVNIDTLKTQLETASGEKRIDLLLELSDSVRSEFPEKALNYAEAALIESEEYGSNGLIAKSYLKISFRISWRRPIPTLSNNCRMN